jgi:hypothetical protein
MIEIGNRVKMIKKEYGRYGDVGMVLNKRMTQFGWLFTIKFKDGVADYLGDSIRKVE